MDTPWGSPPSRKFVTNLGLITSRGPYGDDISTDEWTHHVSYQPGFIALNVHEVDATCVNIKKSKEFGVNLAAFDQNVVASVAGGSTGKEVDKIGVLKELGVEFYPAKKIKALMVKGAALNAECKVIKSMKLGDHIMFVGEVQELTVGDKEPLIYHDGKYWKFGEQIHKPAQDVLDRISALVERFRKK